LVQNTFTAAREIDRCEDQLRHRRINDFVLLVEALHFALVWGEDDIVIVETGLGREVEVDMLMKSGTELQTRTRLPRVYISSLGRNKLG
jgi:hypothetical protein